MSEAKFWANLQTGLYLGDVGQTYFQKGFGLKSEVGPVLARTYQSTTIERLKTLGYQAGAGGIHIKLAKEFGFCYGVDRAVDYAYQTRRQFPDRRVFLSGEIIHNPDVIAASRKWASGSSITSAIPPSASPMSLPATW